MKSTNIYKKINNKGITIISLAVTVIILIILAGISINTIIGEDGVVESAKEQKILQTKTIILEELELAKGYIAREGKGYTDLEKYIDYINEKGLNNYKVTEIVNIDETNAKIIIDGQYVYILTQIGNDVIIK